MKQLPTEVASKLFGVMQKIVMQLKTRLGCACHIHIYHCLSRWQHGGETTHVYLQVAGARCFLSLTIISEPEQAAVQFSRAYVHESTEPNADWASVTILNLNDLNELNLANLNSI